MTGDEKFDFLLNELRDMRQEAKEEFTALREESAALRADNSEKAQRLVAIETNIKQIVGNGRPGIIDEMKAQLKENSDFIGDLKGGIKWASWFGAAGILGMLKHIFFSHAR